MSLAELLIIAVGVSMDAFAVSICKGLSAREPSVSQSLTVGAYFGGFQALMPVIGFFLGSTFESVIRDWDHWIAFLLLLVIGAKMIKEAMSGDDCPVGDFGVRSMLPLAIATSIDALAIGVTFALLRVNIWTSAVLIGVSTFCFSAAGVQIGGRFGARFQKPAQIAGGITLLLIGVKILLEHLGVIHF